MGNRYVGDYPVIGIRPLVDGHRSPLKLLEGWTVHLPEEVSDKLMNGHIGADIITMCSMLHIPVCVHKVKIIELALLTVHSLKNNVTKSPRNFPWALFLVIFLVI